jgi:hypothetical protein
MRLPFLRMLLKFNSLKMCSLTHLTATSEGTKETIRKVVAMAAPPIFRNKTNKVNVLEA